jgi:peptidoglycan/LPS O-acetylase OafA/YrhL
MSKSPTRFFWLDWFRFLAAMVVVLVHARQFAFVEFGALRVDQKSLLFASTYTVIWN